MSTNVDFASIIEDIKKDYFGFEVLIKSWKITPLINMETLQDTGFSIKMYLNSKYAYDIAVLHDWGERLGADSCTVGIKKNKLVLNFKVHTKKTIKKTKTMEKLNEMYEFYYDNGQIKERHHCKDGKLNGKYERWYPNGQIENRCTFKDGKREGLYEAWYSTGQLRQRNNWKNGKLDGIFELWDDNGQLMMYLVFKNNVVCNV